MSKIFQVEWVKHAQQTECKVPKMTATLSRKVAATEVREMGATRQEQADLAKQMVHRLETADASYDKSTMGEAKRKIVKKLRTRYKVCSHELLTNIAYCC